MAQAQARRGDALTKKLRDFSVKYVKISEDEMTRSRKLVKDYIEDHVMAYCRQKSSLPILRLEYTGSVYERLKTEAADVDVMVVLRTTRSAEIEVVGCGVPGYVRLMARRDSVFRTYAGPEGYINPERLRNGWFYSLVSQAVNDFNARPPRCSEVDLVVRSHGPAVQLDIFRKGTNQKFLSVDLVPCFQVGDSYYVAKPYTGKRPVSSPQLLWRQSFSLKEKQDLEFMDTDLGCRHELLRIVKTMVKRQPTSLPLESYCLKTAFMHYIKDEGQNWVSGDALGKHFVGFLKVLQSYLERRNLPHFWLPGVNLLEDIDHTVCRNMAYRLKAILNSEAEMNKVLS